MKCKILVRPTGAYNGAVWPAVGETIDLPDAIAESMAAAGDVEIVKAAAKTTEPKVETRPASKKDVETRDKAKG